ncbi:ABC transporter permease [Paenibacillus sp. HJGM_3]|uniref:ABC transporter permease n=1 Tax=Paenibacillus sp. HJGM_3 TaxID=3379816 RepID=UPI00385C9BC9
MVKRKYITLAKITMQNVIAYRSTYFISLLGSLIFVMATFYLWKAVFENQDQLSGYSWDQMKAYIFVTFLTNSIISWYSETRISRKIISGEVAIDLLKPLDFQKARASETVGSSLMEGCMAAILIILVLLLTKGMPQPKSWDMMILFVISLIASIWIKFNLIYLASLLCFWTTNGMGIAWMRAAITNFFSGALIPLAFFPNWLEMTAKLLPFQGIVYIPASVYLGKLEALEAMEQIGLQIIWIAVLWYCGKWMWNWAVKQVTINGG